MIHSFIGAGVYYTARGNTPTPTTPRLKEKKKKEGRWWDFSLEKYLPEIYNTWLYRPDRKKKTQKNTIEGERFEWNCIQARSQWYVRDTPLISVK